MRENFSSFNGASIYFHIPFCNKKCPYCHFYVIPNKQEYKDLLLQSLLLEWEQVQYKLEKTSILSIYFGGGTPTLFGPSPISTLIALIPNKAKDCEITIEANPEDVTEEIMASYKAAGINRVSIGVQSLEDASLVTLGRNHNSNKACEAIHICKKVGIENISIDLMYELPEQTVESFEKTLSQLKDLPITHLSLYNLTIEPNTAFFKRTLTLPSDEEGLQMLTSAIKTLEECGLNRYEISAFAKPGFESKHNTGYWQARPFLGLGPSAFSYFEQKRYRNVANINRYAKALSENKEPIDFEERLPYPENVHELLAIRLRMVEGADLCDYELPEKTLQKIKDLEKEDYLKIGKRLSLTEKGLLFYDYVATELL